VDTYILGRLRCDADHVIDLARQQSTLVHSGLKGRFRELLIDNLLAPWLPPYVKCGTGMIIAAENKKRQSTQDDVILYDEALCPPVLASRSAPEGVFLLNSVLARIEVKSTLTRDGVSKFIDSSLDIALMKFTVVPGPRRFLFGAFNLLFAFASDAEGKNDRNFEVRRLCEEMEAHKQKPCTGVVSMLCVPGKGFWKIGEVGKDEKKRRAWEYLESEDPKDHLAWFVGCISNSCFQQHAVRQGRDPSAGIESGIGYYLDSPFAVVEGVGDAE